MNTNHTTSTAAAAGAAPERGRFARIGPDHAASVVSVIALAFATDPVARWAFPDPHVYAQRFPEFIEAFAWGAFGSGTAFLALGGRGAAAWLKPGSGPDEDRLLDIIRQSTSETIQRDLIPMLELMEAYHPNDPHWYLPMIGVDPVMQGSGIGSALLRQGLAQCDAEGSPAYLESSNPRNIPLYERFGFEIVGTIKCGAAPPLYPMVRKARPQPHALDPLRAES